MELNPNHPVTQTLHDHWHKIAAIAMRQLGIDHLVITSADIESLPEGMFLVAQELRDGLHVRFVAEKTAHQMAIEHGGLPT